MEILLDQFGPFRVILSPASRLLGSLTLCFSLLPLLFTPFLVLLIEVSLGKSIGNGTSRGRCFSLCGLLVFRLIFGVLFILIILESLLDGSISFSCFGVNSMALLLFVELFMESLIDLSELFLPSVDLGQ